MPTVDGVTFRCSVRPLKCIGQGPQGQSDAPNDWYTGRSRVHSSGPVTYLRRAIKEGSTLLTVIGLTIKHAVCRVTLMLYPILL